MKELSLHILDIARNSINAGAKNIEILVDERIKENTLLIEVKDNGCGMKKEVLEQLSNPFFTTGKKKTGLGIPLLQQHAESAGGKVKIASKPNKGTTVSAWFMYDHIDRQPMGDITETLTALIRSYPEIEWIYNHRINKINFKLDLKQVRDQLDGLEINHPEVINFLKEMIRERLNNLEVCLMDKKNIK